MNHRDNLISLYRRMGLEFVPIDISFSPAIQKKAEADPEYLKCPELFEASHKNIGPVHIIERVGVQWETYYKHAFAEGTHFDSNGVAHEPKEGCFHMTRMHHPMKNFDSLEQFQAYPYAEVDNGNLELLKQKCFEIKNQGYAPMLNMQCTIWETAWYMRSMESLMMDMLSDEDMAIYHLDRITHISCERIRIAACAGVDMVFLGDDIGMQSSIMMSTELYREWLKPRLQKVIQTAKQINPKLIILYHSCGYIKPFIQDLIDVGVDVLNPIQPECMDFKEIFAEFGDRLSFHGTIGTQSIMPFGTTADVKKEVLKNLDIAGKKGGLLPCPTHLLEPEVPWENIKTYVKTCHEYFK